jgi:predicted transcriptional regulator
MSEQTLGMTSDEQQPVVDSILETQRHHEVISRADAERQTKTRRISAEFYNWLSTELQELTDDQALKIGLLHGEKYPALVRRITRVAEDLGVEITIRKTAEGVVCWKGKVERASAKKSPGRRKQTS